jgi:glutamate synthase domain-containing protein 2
MAHLMAMGLELKDSMPIVINALERYKLRDKIKVIVSGKMITPIEAAWAYAMGADSVSTARGFLFSLGCIQALKCSKGTCPTGITTHDRRYTKGLDPEIKAVRVYNYHKNMMKDLIGIAHSCGVESFEDLKPSNLRVYNADGYTIPVKIIQ